MNPKPTRTAIVALVLLAGCADNSGPGIAPPPTPTETAAQPDAAPPKKAGQRPLVPSNQPGISLENTTK